MKKLGVVAAVVAAVALAGPVGVSAESNHVDAFMNPPPPESAYATGAHLGYSWRSTIVYWFGGVTLTDQKEVRASEKDKWWGEDVPLIPADESGSRR
jgi:hypothetical protein